MLPGLLGRERFPFVSFIDFMDGVQIVSFLYMEKAKGEEVAMCL
jgi:hypothetical protein